MTNYEAWIYKAKNDLKSALKLLDGDHVKMRVDRINYDSSRV